MLGDAAVVAASDNAAAVAASGETMDLDALAPEPLAMQRGPVAAPTCTAVTTGSTTSYSHFEFPTTNSMDAYLLLAVYDIQPTLSPGASRARTRGCTAGRSAA